MSHLTHTHACMHARTHARRQAAVTARVADTETPGIQLTELRKICLETVVLQRLLTNSFLTAQLPPPVAKLILPPANQRGPKTSWLAGIVVKAKKPFRAVWDAADQNRKLLSTSSSGLASVNRATQSNHRRLAPLFSFCHRQSFSSSHTAI